MAISYFRSDEVHVFPCAYRSPTYDPEARLNTEKNFANLGNNNLKKSYVISYDTGTSLLKCVIGGYYFEITCNETGKTPTDLANKYLAIKTAQADIISGGAKTTVLAKYSDSSVGVIDTDNGFEGIGIEDDQPTSGVAAFIKPFLDSGALNYTELLPTNLKSGKAANTLDGGSENNNTGSNSLVLGQHNTNQVSDAIVVGQYASNTTAVGAKIAVGNGTSETPSNSFTVLADGTVDAAGPVKTNTINAHNGDTITVGETGDTINVNGNTTVTGALSTTGATTLGSTLGVTGKATLGDSTNKPGAEVWGNLAVNGPINAYPYTGSLTGQINTGTLNINDALGGIAASSVSSSNNYIGSSSAAFSNSYITNTYTDSINRLATSGNIGVNSNIQLNSDASIIPNVDEGSTVSRSKLGDSNHNFSAIYGKLHGTINNAYDGHDAGSGFVDDGKALKVDQNSTYIIEFNTALFAPAGYTGYDDWNTLGILYTGTTGERRYGAGVNVVYTFHNSNGAPSNDNTLVRPKTDVISSNLVLRIIKGTGGSAQTCTLYKDGCSYIRLMKLTNN